MKRIGIYNRFVESAEDLKGMKCDVTTDNFGEVVDIIEEHDTLVFASPVSLSDIRTDVLLSMIHNSTLGFEVVGYLEVEALDCPYCRALGLVKLECLDKGMEVAFSQREKVKKLLELENTFSISINGQDYFIGDSLEDVVKRLKKSYEKDVIVRSVSDTQLQVSIPDIEVSALFEDKKLISITAESLEFDGVSFWESGLSHFIDDTTEEFDELLESGVHTRNCDKFDLTVDENKFIDIDTGKKLKYKQCQMIKASGNTCEACQFCGEDGKIVVKVLQDKYELTVCEEGDDVYFTLS